MAHFSMQNFPNATKGEMRHEQTLSKAGTLLNHTNMNTSDSNIFTLDTTMYRPNGSLILRVYSMQV